MDDRQVYNMMTLLEEMNTGILAIGRNTKKADNSTDPGFVGKATIYKIVKKLVGPIDPIGETTTDSINFKNLIVLTNLVEDLLRDINHVASTYKDCQEHGMERAGRHAAKFLSLIGVE